MLDRWWLQFFNQCGARQRKKYNGILFRLTQADMPAYFGHWGGATTTTTFTKEITEVKKLGQEFRTAILCRMGEEIAHTAQVFYGNLSHEETTKLFLSIAENELVSNPKSLATRMNSLDFMTYTFEDYQVVLSHSIAPNRIIKVIPQGNEFGCILKQQKLQTYSD